MCVMLCIFPSIIKLLTTSFTIEEGTIDKYIFQQEINFHQRMRRVVKSLPCPKFFRIFSNFYIFLYPYFKFFLKSFKFWCSSKFWW